MKFNWVNLLATLLIIGGVILLVERRVNDHHTRHIPTIDEAKADIERQIEGKLGRPLSEAETDMVEVTKVGEQINITLHQPLTGRLMHAIHDAKAATAPSLTAPSASTDSLMSPSSDSIVHMAPESATTSPTTGLP